ncbi:MAG TPA: hypothetical protein VE781_07675 [Kineosporiaceae bacterium]|nr:hypothetical protein [Kineosporiaceae bacterium]
MLTTHRRAAAVAGIGVTLLLAACGGSSSSGAGGGSASAAPKAESQLKGLSAEQVLAKAKEATASAKSLHYHADGTSGAEKILFDVRADKARGAIATVEASGQQVKLIQDTKDVYIGGKNTLITTLAGGKDVTGKWVKTSASNPAATSVLELADPAKFTAQFFTLESGQKVELGTPKTVDGKQTVALVISGGKGGGTMYVSAEGTPYPLLIESAGGSTDKGTVTFSEFDQPVDVQVPAAADVITAPGA